MSRLSTIAAVAAAVVLLSAASLEARPAGPVRALACAPGSADVAAALVGDSVWSSSDGGLSWLRAAVLSPDIDHGGVTASTSDDADPAELPGVIPDLDPAAADEQHRVGSAELTTATAGDIESELVPSGRVDLAVGDDGAWAALLGDWLFVGRPGQGVTGRALVEGALGVRFDGRGGLWVATGHSLLHYPPGTRIGSAPRRFPSVCTAAPVRGADAHELLVPVGDGVASISVAGASKPSIVLVRSGPLAAVAASRDQGLLAVARGRISRLARDGTLVPLGPAPASVGELLAAGDGTLWAFAEGRGWSRSDGTGWRAVTWLTVAVDASGRVWLGTASGPRGPGERSDPPVPHGPLPSVPVGRFVAGAVSEFDREQGDPPCRPPIVLVPRIRLLFGAGRGSTRATELPGPVDEAGLTSWIYAELRLEWSFGPVSPTECVAGLERASALREERRRRVASLVEAWRRAVALEEEARGVSQMIEARTERDRLGELIRINSGIDPPKE